MDLDLGRFVGHVVAGHVGVHRQVHAHRLGALLGGVAGQQAHRLVDHADVELEAHSGHVPGLLVAEQVARSADLEIAHGDLEARAELGVVRQRGQSRARLLRQRRRATGRAGRRRRAPESAPPGRGSGRAGPARARRPARRSGCSRSRCRDRTRRSWCRRARRPRRAGTTASTFSSSPSAIWPCATSHPRLGRERAHSLGGLVDRVHAVVQEEGLATARHLAPDRLGHEVLVVVAHVGLDRAPTLRRCLDHGDVAQAGQRHLQRARDRRGRQRQHVDLEPQLAQQLLLLDAEALLLVHDQQAQVLRAARRARAAGGCRSGCPPCLR